jgi:carboxyl-terminal processing protease
MRIIRSILPLILAIALPASATENTGECASDLSKQTWWDTSGITWDLLSFLDNGGEACWKKQETFLGCYMALRVLANNVGLEIETQTPFEQPERPAIERFGPFLLTAKASNGELTLGQELARLRTRKEKFVQISEFLKQNLAVNKQAFAGLIRHLRVRNNSHSTSPSLIGEAYQAYRRIQDPAYTIVSKADADRFHSSIRVERVGLGIQAVKVGTKVIASPVKDGPAEKAGMRKFDELFAIDGREVGKMTALEFELAARGEEGGQVPVTVKRGFETLELTVTREKLKPFTARLIDSVDGRYGYIVLREFPNGNDCGDIAQVIENFEQQGAAGLILDLRQNPGGNAHFAGSVGGLFVGEKTIAMAVPKIELARRRMVGGKFLGLKRIYHRQTMLPLSILIDESSISASELLAGSMQDYGRAWIVGTRSMGKGVYSTIFGDQLGTFAHMETAAEYLLPSYRSIQFKGVEPDFTVESATPSRLDFRWADLYLTQESIWHKDETNPRADQIAQIRQCVGTGWSPDAEDTQLQYAQKVLFCAGALGIAPEIREHRSANFMNRFLMWRMNRAWAKKERAEKQP